MLPHAGCVFAAAMAVAAPLAAQVTLSGDAALNSEYQARGLTTTNHPVIQSELVLSAPAWRSTVSAGAWASVEGGRYDNPRHHLSENGGAGARVAEWNLWVESTVPMGRLRLTPGVLSYVFPNRAGTTSTSNTVELYVGAAFDAPFAPTLTAWQDVHAVQGGYGELGLSHGIGHFDLGATAGVNWGQSVGDGGALGYYVRRGVTHVELSMGTAWTSGALTVAPTVHLVFGRDPAARLVAPERTAGAKLWLGATIGWSRMVGRRQNDGAGGAAGAGGPAATVASVAP